MRRPLHSPSQTGVNALMASGEEVKAEEITLTLRKAFGPDR